MTEAKIKNATKLNSKVGSTETLDGFGDIESTDTPVRKIKSGPNNLTIILIAIFMTWLVLFMGVTIYQIRSYKIANTNRRIRRTVRDEIDTMKYNDRKRSQIVPDNPTKNSVDPETSDTDETSLKEDLESPKKNIEETVTVEPKVSKTEEEVLPKSTIKTLDEPKKVEEVLSKPKLEEKVGEPVVSVELPKPKSEVVVTRPTPKDTIAKEPISGKLEKPVESKTDEKLVPVTSSKEGEKIVPGSRRESVSPQGVKYVKVKLPRDPNQDAKRRVKRKIHHLYPFMTHCKYTVRTERFEDLKFRPDGENCYRKDFFRINVDIKSTKMRLVVKRAKINASASLNSGKCVTMYHWIYSNPRSNITNAFYLGPYYGNYSVRVFEQAFENRDRQGSFKISGCDEPIEGYTIDPTKKTKEKIISGNVIINRDLFMYSDFEDYQEHLAKKAKEEIYENERLFNSLKSGPKAIEDFNYLNEAINCIYSL